MQNWIVKPDPQTVPLCPSGDPLIDQNRGYSFLVGLGQRVGRDFAGKPAHIVPVLPEKRIYFDGLFYDELGTDVVCRSDGSRYFLGRGLSHQSASNLLGAYGGLSHYYELLTMTKAAAALHQAAHCDNLYNDGTDRSATEDVLTALKQRNDHLSYNLVKEILADTVTCLILKSLFPDKPRLDDYCRFFRDWRKADGVQRPMHDTSRYLDRLFDSDMIKVIQKEARAKETPSIQSARRLAISFLKKEREMLFRHLAEFGNGEINIPQKDLALRSVTPPPRRQANRRRDRPFVMPQWLHR